MTKKLTAFIVIVLLLKSNLVCAQSDEVRFLIDTCISIMKHHAVNANTVDWDMLKKNALAKAVSINNPYQLGPVMRFLYQSVNDFHGAFFIRTVRSNGITGILKFRTAS